MTNLDKSLASGLQTTAMVEYHPDKNEDICDQLLISIGNKTIEVPLIGYVLFIIEANILSIFQMKIRVIVIFSIFSSRAFCIYSILKLNFKNKFFSKL